MKYKIVVSGSAELSDCCEDIQERSKTVGREIIKQGGVIFTGATTGVPYFAAHGAKEENGLSIGISPAISHEEHVKVYQLPDDAFDLIIYTGLNYSGRNMVLARAADAVVVICGGFGTLNEFTVALEDEKPIGILTQTGGVAEHVNYLLEHIKDPHFHGRGKVIFDSDPKKLVAKLIKMAEKENAVLAIKAKKG